jgi:dTDP-4-amino-4,6-dideoxygalactose transaminase
VACASLTPREIARAAAQPVAVSDGEAELCDILHVPHVALFASARGAISAALGAIDAPGPVVIPAFTCVAVANAALSAGREIVWSDVDDVGRPVFGESPRNSILFAQDTYGFPSSTSNGPPVVRDASHRADLTRDASSATVTVTSCEHSKWLSGTGGGVAVIRDAVLAERMRAMRDEHGVDERPARQVAFSVCDLLAGRWLYRGPTVAGRATARLSRWIDQDKADGQSQAELAGRGVDPRLLGRPTEFATGLMVSQMRRLEEIATHRSRLTGFYDARFGIERPPLPLVRYPLSVTDRAAAAAAFRRHGWELGRPWFSSPLHPTDAVAERFGLRSVPPTAGRLSDTVINLPTHPLVRPKDAAELAELAGWLGAVPLYSHAG